ncbi:MAG: lysylphosphatidylglycerol synthase transmembrane domain-containing protein [Deltaproteobacteria bacterium]
MNRLKEAWGRVDPRLRSAITFTLKAAATVGAFYLLFTHKVPADDGGKITTFEAIRSYIPQIEAAVFWKFVILAALIKFVGILASMYRWILLLRGQGIEFPFVHIFGSFLIGRFLGTFLPSTLGLDGYKLYDASRFSHRTVEVTAATAVEKVLGVVGIFLTYLVALPLGISVLGERAYTIGLVTVPVAAVIISGFFFVLFKPGPVQWMIENLPIPAKDKVSGFITRVSNAAAAYSRNKMILVNAALQSFVVHFTTAAMYFFTALAVGAVGASFWQVTFASSIQIFATVMSPFTIAGEGIREIVQALLLAKHIGMSQSIISAALGFWAAEALTLTGAFFLWARKKDYSPAFVTVNGRRLDD